MIPPEQQGTLGAGAPCTADDACRSGTCAVGFCAGGECGSDADCDAGWSCVERVVVNWFGPNRTYHQCGVPCGGTCPESFTCGPDDDVCTPHDFYPLVTIVAPPLVELGEPAMFHADASSPAGRAIERVTWHLQDGTQLDGLDITVRFSQFNEDLGPHDLYAEVVDASGDVNYAAWSHISEY